MYTSEQALGQSDRQVDWTCNFGLYPKKKKKRESWNKIMYFNQAPPRTRHKAQCQNDSASSALTSVVDGRVKYKQQQHRVLGLCFRGISLKKGTRDAAAWLTLTTVQAKEGIAPHDTKTCKAAEENKGMTSEKAFKDD